MRLFGGAEPHGVNTMKYKSNGNKRKSGVDKNPQKNTKAGGKKYTPKGKVNG